MEADGSEGADEPAIWQVDATAAPILAAIHAEAVRPAWSVRDFATLLSGPAVIGLLAGDGTQRAGATISASSSAQPDPLGMLLMTLVPGESEILTLCVLPDAQRRGVGRALVGAANRIAAQAGVEQLFLEVAEDNGAALGLYSEMGFQIVGRRPNYYRAERSHPMDAICMVLTVEATASQST